MKKITLTEKYIKIKNKIKCQIDNHIDTTFEQELLDNLFHTIMIRPINNLSAAIDKLRFAYHCLTEEEDIEETANILCQVCFGLEQLALTERPTTASRESAGISARRHRGPMQP